MARVDEANIIDREAEVEIFARMLHCDTPRRVLVVSDRGGMGKSDVLRKLRYVCEYTHDVPVALIQLEDFATRPDIFAIVRRLRDALDASGAELPTFDSLNNSRLFGNTVQFAEQVRSIHGMVDLRGAQVTSSTVAGTIFNIERAEHVSLPPWNEEAESQAREMCIEAFLVDLLNSARKNPTVLMFDTVDNAGEELLRWLFLELVRKRVLTGWQSHKLIVVLAGQKIAAMLDRRLRPEHRECIEPIASLSRWELHHVAEFLQVHGFCALKPGQVEAIHRLLGEGNTLTAALAIAKLVSEEAA
jgi:hypothetical protein